MATELITTNNGDRLETYFDSLETQKTLLTTCTQLYKTATTQFSSLQQTLTLKSQTLDSQIETLNTQILKTLDSLSRRENSIPELESSAAARVEERRGSAISEIEKLDPKSLEKRDFVQMVGLYCRIMDVGRLLKYLVVNRKEFVAVRSVVVKKIVEEAVDVSALVLNGLDEFLVAKEAKAGVADKRWAMSVLVQGLFEFEGEFGVKGVKGVPASVAERAFAVVVKWKGLVDREDDGRAAEAVMFLQVILVFGLKEKFDDEYLRKLVMEFAGRREMAKIARALGFGENLGDMIEELLKSGKETEAIYFAFGAGLTAKYPPVHLLKSYLRSSRNNATAILKEGNYSVAATDEASNLELKTIRSIIKCVEDNKLEDEFPLDTLRKRVPQLEKAKSERKKVAPSSSTNNGPSSHKRSHRGGGGGGCRTNGPPPSFRSSSKSGRFSNDSPSYAHRNLSHSHASPSYRHNNISHSGHTLDAARYLPAHTYNYPSPNVMYETPPVIYSSSGATHSQIPAAAALPQHYSLSSSQNVGSGQTAYGTYDYSTAASVSVPAYPPYQQ